MAKLTREQERLHAQACQLVDLERDLTDDERAFVLDHWQESSTGKNASQRAFFTPAGLARDMSLEVGGGRIIDLAAGIGRLAFHNRNLWGNWPHPGPEMVCVERNPAYVRVGHRVMPEARWICADILDLPDVLGDLGTFDCAIGNPPFGAVPRSRTATGGYAGRRFEYHTIALAAQLARRGVFIIPQNSSPFRYSGRPQFEHDQGDFEYTRFAAATGITLEPTCGIDTTYYDGDWHDVCPRVEIVTADFTELAHHPTQHAAAAPGGARTASAAADQRGQLSLLGQ